MKSDWRPGISNETLRWRATMLTRIREFFYERGVLEVDVPLLGTHCVTDVNIEAIGVDLRGGPGYLQTSPEYFMKRLLAAGSDDIFCLGKAFRAGETGRLHNLEFTLLEWYRVGWDEHQLMTEVADLVAFLKPDTDVTHSTYCELFQRATGLNPHSASLPDLQEKAAAVAGFGWASESRANCLDALFGLKVQREMPDGLVFVADYPECMAALAQTRTDESGTKVSRRFECFLNGIELANGYFELRDASEQTRRFQTDLEQRQILGRSLPEIDETFIACLEEGLPSCSGVALGVDRLLMEIRGEKSLAAVMPFDWSRC